MLKSASRLSHNIWLRTQKKQFVQSCGIHNDEYPTADHIRKGLHEFPESHANFEISTVEWEYVERLLPMEYVPKPNIEPGAITPSGWRAPKAKKDDYPYFVMRNRNHLFRLYKNFHPITQKLRTNLKGVEGDVFALGKELKTYLFPISGKRCIDLRVHEPHGVITIRGDYKMPVLDFLYEKGF